MKQRISSVRKNFISTLRIWEQGRINDEIKKNRMDVLNEQLRELDIENVPVDRLEQQVTQRLPLLRHNREGSRSILMNHLIQRNNEQKNEEWWSKVARFIAFPILFAVGSWAIYTEWRHNEHFDETLSDYVPYPYLNVRTNVSLSFFFLIASLSPLG